MGLLADIYKDICVVDKNRFLFVISNRGFHALLIYRISNYLWRKKVPLIPLLLTRIIQILYSIDIDYRCKIEGGVTIVHGVGLVIGKGAVIKKGCKLYHGVTLGRKHTPKNDGFPILGENVLVGAGAKLLGPIKIGNNVIIGANAVVINYVPDNCIAVGVPAKIIPKNNLGD